MSWKISGFSADASTMMLEKIVDELAPFLDSRSDSKGIYALDNAISAAYAQIKCFKHVIGLPWADEEIRQKILQESRWIIP